MARLDSVRVGSFAMILGGLFAILGNALHPRGAGGMLGSLSVDEEVQLVLGNLAAWYPSHTALILFPAFLLLGYAALYRIVKGGDRVYATPAFALVGLGVLLIVISLVLDGFVTPLLAADYQASSGATRDTLAALFSYNFLVSVALLGPAFLTYLAGIGLFGASIVRTKALHPAVGWAGVAIGAAGVVGFVAGVFGPYWVLSLAFTPLAIVFSLWAISVGALMARKGEAA